MRIEYDIDVNFAIDDVVAHYDDWKPAIRIAYDYDNAAFARTAATLAVGMIGYRHRDSDDPNAVIDATTRLAPILTATMTNPEFAEALGRALVGYHNERDDD